MVSEFPYYDEEDPELTDIVRQVDELVLNKQKMLCQLDDIVRRAKALEQIMLRHQERLIAEDNLLFWLKIGQLYSMTRKNKLPAIDALSKVVILDPRVTDAWDTLAEVFCDLGDFENAEFCLKNSLRQVRRKVPLRNMAAICRMLAKKYPDRKYTNLLKGLNLAKEAVDMDINDGISWEILGNAYLSTHLNIKKDFISAKLALSAYKQAVNMGNVLNSELFYYQGYVSTYCEIYGEALLLLDKSILLDNNEEQPINLRNSLLSFLCYVHNACSTFGKLTPKRLAKFQKGLEDIDVAPIATSLEAEPACVCSLQLGENPVMFICGKVIWCAPAADGLPLACGCIDANGQVFVITMRNLTPRVTFFVGEVITVPKPHYKLVSFKYDDQYFVFHSLRVDNPTALLVNQVQLTDAYFKQE